MKRHGALRKLSSDHHNGLVLARRAQQAGESGDPQAVRAAWQAVESAFERELAPHFEIEELYMVPAFERAGEQALLDTLHADHVVLRACIAAGAPRDGAALVRFGERLAQHIRFEERELFEAAQRCFTEEELARVAEASGPLA